MELTAGDNFYIPFARYEYFYSVTLKLIYNNKPLQYDLFFFLHFTPASVTIK